MEKKFYHLTHPTKVDSIKNDGLKCSEDGYVYLVEDVFYTNPYTGKKENTFNEIACGQIFTDRYTAICVDTNGLDIEGYEEGEYICQWCYRVKTDCISPERLTIEKTYKTVPTNKMDKKLIQWYNNGLKHKRPLIAKDKAFKVA